MPGIVLVPGLERIKNSHSLYPDRVYRGMEKRGINFKKKSYK